MEPDPDALAPWIAELHQRLERGELRGLPLISHDTLLRVEADLVARIMLAELDAYEQLPPAEQAQLDNVVQHRFLLWDLLWLRECIG